MISYKSILRKYLLFFFEFSKDENISYLKNATETLNDEDQRETESTKKYADPSSINGAFTCRQVYLEESAKNVFARYRC